MPEQIKKIKRDICIIKYRNLPLLEYVKDSDVPVEYFPYTRNMYWIKHENNTSKELVTELIALLKLMEFKSFIFLDACNKPWVSKKTEQRKDFKPLIKTIDYFKTLKLTGKFNGGVYVERGKLKEFLPHFYRITQCDGGFFEHHFTDIEQNIVFYIHYSGEIKLLVLNKKANKKFLTAVKQTRFFDTLRENVDRIK